MAEEITILIFAKAIETEIAAEILMTMVISTVMAAEMAKDMNMMMVVDNHERR